MKKYSHKIMMEDPLAPKRLNREQKEAVVLLSVGTFLEYFDLLLYVHMAVLLNELFFPKTDPYTASLLSAFAFCSTYVLRPIGALIFGWIGDHIGRRHTVIITTTMMAISCLFMTGLPTYAQIGITASWLITICRMVQGISSMSELVGATIYLTEITKPPIQYPIVALTSLCHAIGGLAALGVAKLVTSSTEVVFGWRLAFLIGAFIAVIGISARKKLRETPEFADKLRVFKIRVDAGAAKNNEESPFDKNLFDRGTVEKKTSLAYFLIQCASPVCFYFGYVHCGNVLKHSCGFSAEQVIHQNFIASLFDIIGLLVVMWLSMKISPLKIIKTKCLVFLAIMFVTPYVLVDTITPGVVYAIQYLTLLFFCSDTPAQPIIYSNFAVLKRFSYVSFIFAVARAIMYPITSFGLAYLTEKLGPYGLLIIMLPVGIGFLWGVNYFQKLENAKPPETAPAKDVNAYKAAKEAMGKPVNAA